MKYIITGFLLVFLSAGSISAQQCGPGCPVCSGPGNNEGAMLSQRSMVLSAISIPTADEETTVLNARMALTNWLDAGAGYAFRTEKVLWNVRAQVLGEQADGLRPALLVGSGSVQAGGADQSAYAQLVRSVRISDSFGLQLSAGAATLLPDFDRLYGLAGVSATLNKRYSVVASYDGESFHQGVSWVASSWLTMSFLMVESEYPALSIAVRR